MPYATVKEYIQEFGLREASQLLEDDEGLLEEASLAQYRDGVEISATGDARAAFDRALQRIEDMLKQSANYIDGYISRYLPLSEAQIAKTPLRTCNLELARCQLMEDADSGTESTEKRCKKWRDWLRDVMRPNGVKLVTQETPAKSSRKIHQGQSHSNFKWGHFP